jgi:hypothetical protein
VQTGHACLKAGRTFAQLPEPSHLIVLAVESQAHLLNAAMRIQNIGIKCIVFNEPDDNLGFTAACTEPVLDPRRRFFRHYPLWEPSPYKALQRGPP